MLFLSGREMGRLSKGEGTAFIENLCTHLKVYENAYVEKFERILKF